MRSGITKCRQLERKLIKQQKVIDAEFKKWSDAHTEGELQNYRRGMLALVQKLGFAPVSPVPPFQMQIKEVMERLKEVEESLNTPGNFTDAERWQLRFAAVEGWRRYRRGESICK